MASEQNMTQAMMQTGIKVDKVEIMEVREAEGSAKSR